MKVSYLDFPELALVAQVAPSLVPLTNDPVMHNYRLRIVYPSRVQHNLFAKGPLGDYLRPTVGDLVHRGVMKGLAIERQWRMGTYFYSLNVSTHVSRAYRKSMVIKLLQTVYCTI